MAGEDLQSRCELGQQQLMRTEYLAAERTLAEAAADAWLARDFDTLSRLYMPLQEARRQKRQRCGEGVVALDLIAESAADEVDGRRVVENYPHGQLLVAGWGTIEPARTVRQLAAEHGLYVETFLAAVFPVGAGRAIAIVPHEDVALPDVRVASVDELLRRLPAHSMVLADKEIPSGARKGTSETYAQVMAMWERLHAPFLAAADATPDLVTRIERYRQTIRVDYACEFAHQRASMAAREIVRHSRS